MIEETKKEIEKVKETAEAHGTLSEEASEEKAKDATKISEEMIEKDSKEKPEKISDEEISSLYWTENQYQRYLSSFFREQSRKSQIKLDIWGGFLRSNK